MEDEYLKFKYPEDPTLIEVSNWINILPKESGILFSIEYDKFTQYGISTGFTNGSMKYHRLNDFAIVNKVNKNDNPNQYWVYSEYLGNALDTTFEEFKIKRDKLLKEMVFK